ncbi:MAG: hypothetical protein AB1696_00580 [Planctomycetota bacterium]
MTRTAVIGVIVFLLIELPSAADVLHLKNGRTIEGEVTLEGDVYIVKRGAGVMRVPKISVARIEEKKPLHEIYREKLAAVGEKDAEAHFQLGCWCLSNGLRVEAKKAFRDAIAIDPKHEASRKQLGYREINGVWHEKCGTCDGEGKVQCLVCRYAKNLQRPCPNPDCGKTFPCAACNGQGAFTCTTCNGVGKLKCHKCDGTGKIESATGGQPERCATCKGEGLIDCQACTRGKVVCRVCQGKGVKQVDCPKCGNKGYIRIVCPECGGGKKVVCEGCKGIGAVPVKGEAR